MQHNTIYNPHLEGDAFYWSAGPTGILLSHGFTATTAEVRLLAERLHRHDYTLAAPLLPGHYTTPADLNRVHWQDWVGAVEEWYQRLQADCRQVIVGGESTGGLLALYLAARHPEICAVLLYAPALRLQISPGERIKMRLLAPFVPFISKEISDHSTPWQGYAVVPLKGTLQLLRLQSEIVRILPQVTQPVLLVMGRRDNTVHPVTADVIQSALTPGQVELHWMENSSHVIIIDRELPEVTRLTLQFVRRHCPTK